MTSAKSRAAAGCELLCPRSGNAPGKHVSQARKLRLTGCSSLAPDPGGTAGSGTQRLAPELTWSAGVWAGSWHGERKPVQRAR